MKKILLGALLLASTNLFTSCKKDEDTTPTPNPTVNYGQFKLEVEPVWGPTNGAFSLSTPLVHPSTGDNITFSKLMFYVSGYELKKTDGSIVKREGLYHLLDASKTNGMIVTIDSIPEGNYSEISFNIGVDSTRNVSGAQTGALDPANGMFWSWNTGYIFFKAEGTSPQSPTGNFRYHIGGFREVNNAIRKVTMNTGISILGIRPNTSPQLHVMMNVARLWHGGILMANVNNIHMPGQAAMDMATRYQAAFVLDHIHN